MKKALKKEVKEIYFYLNGVKNIIDRDNEETYPVNLSGDISPALYGNITAFIGEISPDLYGKISLTLSGNITKIYGDCTGITGDLDECEITEEDRKKGINIKDLIK